MKRFIILFMASALMSGMASAQGWEQQISPIANDLNAVVFVDSSYGWAVGDSGTIAYTTDSGVMWTLQTSGTTLQLNGLDFVDANHGWAVGDFGTILRTTDGGNNWTAQTSGTDSSLTEVVFINENRGWAVGGNWSDFTNLRSGIILRTTNGGEVWTTQFSDTGFNFSGVDFVNENNGRAAGGRAYCPHQILHTTNGGDTWVPQDSLNPVSSLADVDFVDENQGWVVGSSPGWWGEESFVSHTTDGGETWTLIDVQTRPLRSVDMVDLSNGWALGGCCLGPVRPGSTGNVILHTTDGGITWVVQLATSVAGCHPELILTNLDFVDISHGWAVGNNGQILRYDPTLDLPNERGVVQPSSYNLECYPNPFNPSTTIAYDLHKAGHVSLRVFDLLGREVAVLKDGFVEAGTHHAVFDGGNLASGVYFARLDAGEFTQTKKLMLLK
jgi:photosystem II stability/assembly factor-like uncharacterized protein